MPNLDPNLFSVVWELLHLVSFREGWTRDLRLAFLRLVLYLRYLLPCDGCRLHLDHNLNALLGTSAQVNAFLSSVDIPKWTYDLHMTVSAQVAERRFKKLHAGHETEPWFLRALETKAYAPKPMPFASVKLMYSFVRTMNDDKLKFIFGLFKQSDEFDESLYAKTADAVTLLLGRDITSALGT